jgi:hypothetical protein
LTHRIQDVNEPAISTFQASGHDFEVRVLNSSFKVLGKKRAATPNFGFTAGMVVFIFPSNLIPYFFFKKKNSPL